MTDDFQGAYQVAGAYQLGGTTLFCRSVNEDSVRLQEFVRFG